MPKFVSSDGRVFTDYHSSSYLNEVLQKKYGVTSSNEYRKYLTKNGLDIQKDLKHCFANLNYAVCPICKKAMELKK